MKLRTIDIPSPGVGLTCEMTFGILKFDVTEDTGPTGDGPGILFLHEK